MSQLPPVLDPARGGRMMYFDRQSPCVLFGDQRRETLTVTDRSHGNASRDAFETALGCPVLDEFALYQQAEERSKRRCGLL